MRATVLTDARLLKLAGQFAWLDIDTEQPRNFAFVERFPIEAWPTIYVIDPAAEKVVVRWMGTATAEELERLLLDAERTLRQAQTDAAGAALANGMRLAAERRHAEAASAFNDALAAGGPRWPERARAADAFLQALSSAGDPQVCAGAAEELLPRLERGPAFARVAAAGLGCATGIEHDASREPAIRAVEPFARVALGIPTVLSDDKLWLYDQLLSARKALGDEPGARRVAREWLAYVQDASRKARTPLARSALDGARLTAAMELGEVAAQVPALEASVKALPGESFAHGYLAVALLETGRPKEALEAARRAVALADGPRKVRAMTVEAQALQALGETDAAKAALEAAIAHGEGLPEAVRPRGHLSRARKLLGEWGKAGD